jgi:hypothetical protein
MRARMSPGEMLKGGGMGAAMMAPWMLMDMGGGEGEGPPLPNPGEYQGQEDPYAALMGQAMLSPEQIQQMLG